MLKTRMIVMSAATVCLLAAGQADAGTITKTGTGKNIHLLYTAAAGETNDVTVTDDTTHFFIDDAGVASITIDNVPTATGCTSLDANTKSCPKTDLFYVQVDAEDGNDTVSASGVSDSVRFFGGDGNDSLDGSLGADVLDGGAGNDPTLFGDAGDDVINPGVGTNSSNGGPGIDTLSYVGNTGGVTVNIGAGTGDDAEPATNYENAIGTAFVDNITGTTGANQLEGRVGNDILHGGDGDDFLEGGDDDDQLFGENDNDKLDGGLGVDVLNDGSGIDTYSYADRTAGITLSLVANTVQPDGETISVPAEVYSGSSFSDTMTGSTSADKFFGQGETDTLNGGDGNDTLVGGTGADHIRGDTGTLDVASYEDKITNIQLNLQAGTNADDDDFTNIEKWLGGTAADNMTGRNGTVDVLDGNTGGDTIVGGSGPVSDVLAGGGDVDTVSYDDGRATPVSVDLTSSAGPDTDSLSGFENATGGDGNDRLTGDASANRLDGGTGDDTLIGAGGVDDLVGGTGTGDIASYEERDVAIVAALGGAHPDGDTYSGIEGIGGGSAGDTLTGDANANVLVGGGGPDHLIGGAGADQLNGGDKGDPANSDAAADLASYEDRNTPVSVTLGGANTDGDTLNDIQGVIGGSGADTLTGDGLANTLVGGAGADTLLGAGGADALFGGAADGTPDADADTLSYADGRAAGVTLDLLAATNSDGDTYSDIQAFLGSNFADTLTGSDAADSFSGGLGDDTINGNGGDDTLSGGDGADAITGGAGVDAFDGGVGDDKVLAKDGVADTGTCGDGNDPAELDAIDAISACEPVIPPPPPPADKDGDGFNVNLDCDDNSAAVKPGAVEIVGNAVDENCDGIKAPFPLLDAPVGNLFTFTATFTRIDLLEVRRTPAGAKIVVTCKSKKKKNKGCPFKTKTLKSKGKTVSLASLFKKRKIPVGTVITLTITAPSTIGKVVIYTTRKSRSPKVVVKCLVPGGKPAAC